jgi:hypothetical protein
MGFSESTFYGYVKKFIVGNRQFSNVFVELDLKNRNFNLYIPEKGEISHLIGKEESFQDINRSNIQLLGVEIFTPILKVKAGGSAVSWCLQHLSKLEWNFSKIPIQVK